MPAARATLTISSKNYSSWSLRGWLVCRLADLRFQEVRVPIDDPSTRAELLLLSPSFLVPCLTVGEAKIWDVLAIAEYLAEEKGTEALFPADRLARAHCRSISGEMHQGFANLRSALPMNIKARFPGFKLWAGVQPDIERIVEIWRDCLSTYGGPFLFGETPSLADAMYAPVCIRFHTYDVALDTRCSGYVKTILAWQPVKDWSAAAREEPDELEELDVEF